MAKKVRVKKKVKKSAPKIAQAEKADNAKLAAKQARQLQQEDHRRSLYTARVSRTEASIARRKEYLEGRLEKLTSAVAKVKTDLRENAKKTRLKEIAAKERDRQKAIMARQPHLKSLGVKA